MFQSDTHAARPSPQAKSGQRPGGGLLLEEQQCKALQSGIWRGVRPGTALTSSGCSDSGSYRKQTPLTPAVVRRRIGTLGLLSAPAESRAREANGCERWEGAGLSLHDSARSRRAAAERLRLRRPSPWPSGPLLPPPFWCGSGPEGRGEPRRPGGGKSRVKPGPTRRRSDAVPLVGGRREVFVLEDVPG